ncbi:40S ribosomal protein S12 [Galdieria sulphuraria]|nr:40S ribosomal protein S12 [Galdieria sulphuraria]
MADTELLQAIQEVLKKALIFDGVTKGIRESVRCIEAGQAQLVILAEDCDQPGIPSLVEALCAEQSVNLVKVPERKQLGEWAGLCKIDQEGKATKVVACSCVSTLKKLSLLQSKICPFVFNKSTLMKKTLVTLKE